MSEENPVYPVMEIAVATESLPDNPSGAERKKVGDIIAIRKSGQAIGTKEGKKYIWMHIEGLEEDEFTALTLQVYEPTDPETGQPFDKRRYCVPMAKIQEVYPLFDESRALDTDDLYQPFVILDTENYSYISIDPPFQVSGLVWDKALGEYL